MTVPLASLRPLLLPRKVAATFAGAPLLYPLLQLPEASIDIVERFLGKQLEHQPIVALLLLLPYFWVASTLSTALTFAAVMESDSGRRPTVKSAFKVVEPHLLPLLAACSLAGLVILLGLTLLIPGVYFMAVYLFVPFLVIWETERRSAFAVLNRSKRLAERNLLATLGLTLLVIGVGLVFHFAGEYLGTWLGKLSPNAALSEALFFAVKVFLSAIVGATMNLAVSHFFFSLVPAATASGTSQAAS